MTRQELLEQITTTLIALPHTGPLLVGIDGVDAAGKTRLTEDLVPLLEKLGHKTVRASIDGFHHPSEKRHAQGTLSPEGYFEDSFDYDFLIKEFLTPLRAVTTPTRLRSAKFDGRKEGAVEKFIDVDPGTIVLFEGVFLFRPELEAFWDYKIFMDIGFEQSLLRGTERDADILGGTEAAQEKYLKRYIPGQKIYHERVLPRLKADLIIKNNDPERPRIHSDNARS